MGARRRPSHHHMATTHLSPMAIADSTNKLDPANDAKLQRTLSGGMLSEGVHFKLVDGEEHIHLSDVHRKEAVIDLKSLKGAFERLEKPSLFPRNPMFDELLGASGDVVVERTQSIFYLVNLMSALIFNSFAGIALAPYNVEDFEGFDRTVANSYNVTAAMILVLNIINTLLTTYILVGLNAESETTIFNFLLKEDGSTFIYFLITSGSAVLIIVLVFCVNWLHTDKTWALAMMASVIFVLIALVLHFGTLQARLMPYQYSGWGIFANLGLSWDEDTKHRAAQRGTAVAMEARYNILGTDNKDSADLDDNEGMPDKGAATLEGIASHDEPQYDENTVATARLAGFIRDALLTYKKKGVVPVRCYMLSKLLTNEDLDLDLLKTMAGERGSSSEHMLVELIVGLGEGRSAITLGEVLCIVRRLHDAQEQATVKEVASAKMAAHKLKSMYMKSKAGGNVAKSPVRGDGASEPFDAKRISLPRRVLEGTTKGPMKEDPGGPNTIAKAPDASTKRISLKNLFLAGEPIIEE